MYSMGDIVRLKSGRVGLYEITGSYDQKTYQYSVTNNECDTEHYVKHSDLIFVCSIKDRKDI